MKHTIYLSTLVLVSLFFACSPAGGDKRGHEFMPDMVHSTAYEANLYNYYPYNRWGTEEDYKHYATPRQSVKGTVARGQTALANASDMVALADAQASFYGTADGAIAMAPNGSVSYPYANTEDERLRATREITQNPFPITAEGLAKGKELYNIYCGICHGEKGDGQGYLVREGDPARGITPGVYPAAPISFLLDTFVMTSPGRLYHGIMYGKNVMGSYADKLSYQERWEVIHYIRSLQAASVKAEYSPTANTFNREAKPWAEVAPMIQQHAATVQSQTHDNVHGDDAGQHESNSH